MGDRFFVGNFTNATDQKEVVSIGCGARGNAEIKSHPYFGPVGDWPAVDWDVVPACTIPSPMKGVKGPRTFKKKNETEAQKVGLKIAEAEAADDAHSNEVRDWDFVSSKAVEYEYVESVRHCVATI